MHGPAWCEMTDVTAPTEMIDWTKESAEPRVMAAALRLFTMRGFQAVGIREIAQEAGISTATLYHYMKTKEDLLLALMADRMMRITEAAQDAIAGLEEPASEFAALVRTHVAAHALFPSHVVDDELRSLSPDSRGAVVTLRDRYEEIWDDVLTRGNYHTGPFAIAEPHLARLALIGMCNSVNRWFSAEGPASVESVADYFADLALAMVGSHEDGRAPLQLRDLDLPPASQYVEIVRRAYAGVTDIGSAPGQRAPGPL